MSAGFLGIYRAIGAIYRNCKLHVANYNDLVCSLKRMMVQSKEIYGYKLHDMAEAI